MNKFGNIMRRATMRLRRAFSGPASPREQITAALDDTLRQSTFYAQNAIALVIEIDGFHTLHRYYSGQDLAYILSTIESRLKGSLLARDMVRRLDGGQFAVVLSPLRALSPEDVLIVAGQVQHLVAVPIISSETQAKVTVSIGCALAETEALTSGDAMLEAARIAQAEASAKGPAGLRFYVADMGEQAAMRRDLGKDAHGALTSGAITAFFQPQISLQSQTMTGLEALARWQHADRGLISPADFLPVLEEAGLMRKLGKTMLRDALTALRTWDAEGLKVPRVSVNMCGEELRHQDLLHDIKTQLDYFGISPDRLAIEVLETVIVGDKTDPIITNLSDISELGCHIDLDDFGTGHASIKSVRNFAVDRIKIDRSFVIDIDRDPEQQRMVSTILSMAGSLAVDTLAEGVETEGEVAHLSKSGCGHAQGYAIARPLPAAEIGNWIKAQSIVQFSAHQSHRLQ